MATFDPLRCQCGIVDGAQCPTSIAALQRFAGFDAAGRRECRMSLTRSCHQKTFAAEKGGTLAVDGEEEPQSTWWVMPRGSGQNIDPP
jgi:hypothetical protein